jgi:hypothetical protein
MRQMMATWTAPNGKPTWNPSLYSLLP